MLRNDPRPLLERLSDHMQPALDGCIHWTGRCNEKGYGTFTLGTKNQFAHRTVYQLTKGPIPPGMLVCHRCDTPPCVNPDHLWLGTNADNLADMRAKGRHRKLTCKLGHPLVQVRNQRRCKQCTAEQRHRYYKAQRASARAVG